MPIICDRNETACLITLKGEVNIFCAAELKKSLMEALESGKELRVDLEGVTEVDITALQLLRAAENAATASGTGFTVQGSISEDASAALSDLGIEKFLVVERAG